VFQPVLGSTNDLAIELAPDARLCTPLLVIAERQTAGRGRGANRWWSARGSLTFSLIFDPRSLRVSPADLPRVSLTAALAVCDVIQTLAPQAVSGVRWPNDVFAAGKKICGVLPEFVSPTHLVLGIGLNANNSFASAPAELHGIGVSLCEITGRRFDLTDVLLQVLRQLQLRLDQLATGDAQLASTWSAASLLTGRIVELDLGTRRVRGRCRGIDPDGSLVLKPADSTPQRFFGGIVVRTDD
jgi:BirA family biotin operon repressor/biotin-[acetyl-CoA-carboxylase] ligase